MSWNLGYILAEAVGFSERWNVEWERQGEVMDDPKDRAELVAGGRAAHQAEHYGWNSAVRADPTEV